LVRYLKNKIRKIEFRDKAYEVLLLERRITHNFRARVEKDFIVS